MMLSIVNRVGRCSKLIPNTLINFHQQQFLQQLKYSLKQLTRGYVVPTSVKYLNKYNNKSCQTTTIQYSTSVKQPYTSQV